MFDRHYCRIATPCGLLLLASFTLMSTPQTWAADTFTDTKQAVGVGSPNLNNDHKDPKQTPKPVSAKDLAKTNWEPDPSNILRSEQSHGNPLRGEPHVPFSLITPRTLDELHSPLLRRDLKIRGAQSCAAASCHGGPRQGVATPYVSRGNEYQLWFENDPHAQSWRTICSDESVRMMTQLKIIDGDRIIDPVGFDNCLACHNTTMRHNEPRKGIFTHEGMATAEGISSQEGVGCASCHGPSERWIGNHFTNGWSAQYATHAGFVNAGDLTTRARMCASCHIGDKDRDMNHDIIAAGHPTLRYELATYHSWQPKHWRDAEASDRTYYEAQLWLSGQIAATDAALALIETRAADAHTVSQWPELAAHDCASCHHQLGFKNDRNAVSSASKSLAPLAQWNDSGMRWLIDYREQTGVATVEDARLWRALDQVRDTMQAQAKPDRAQAAAAAKTARHALHAWLHGSAGSFERSVMRSDRLGQVVVAAAGRNETWRTWESAVQFYLAAVAARESWPGGWSGPLYDTAEALRQGLRYPEMRTLNNFETADDSLPTANRAEAMQLGVTLAGWLGNVNMELQPIIDGTTYGLEDQELLDLRAELNRISERWKKKRAEQDAKDAEKKTDDKGGEKKEPEFPDRPDREPAQPRRSLEDLKKALDALESDSDE